MIWRKYCFIIAGAIIQGFAMGVFLFPHSIPSGGAGGITVLLNHWFNIPMSIGLWIVNASMLMVAVHYLGTESTLGTLIGITITSLSVNFFEENVYIPYINSWFDLFIGSLILGIGVGTLLREGVSQGGIGILALIISRSRGIAPGKPLFWINGFIFVLTAYVINWQIVIQAVICQWLSTRVVDLIYELRIRNTLIALKLLPRKK